jgi:hypothetical protein
MAKKTSKKKRPTTKKTAAKKPKVTVKAAARKLQKKKPVKKTRPVSKKTPVKKNVAAKRSKNVAAKRSRAVSSKKQDSELDQTPAKREFKFRGVRSRASSQAGDSQGLSNRQGADSESVEELVEEGNAFEADVVAGVERAGDSNQEVHTHEVSEDDVPQEYLDKD